MKLNRIVVLALTLFVLVALGSVFLFSCTTLMERPGESGAEEGEIAMTEEEVIEVNAQIILEHFDGVDYSNRISSNEDVSRHAAATLIWASDSKIASIDSKPYGKNSLALEIVDEKGETYIVGIGEAGYIATIKDIDGNYLYNSPY